VAGREEDEEEVETVAEPPESRDCGLLRPVVGIVLWFKGLDLVVVVVAVAGETADVEAAGRNGIIPRGLDALRLSPAFGFGGDGESSIMRTQPAESRFLLFSVSFSLR